MSQSRVDPAVAPVSRIDAVARITILGIVVLLLVMLGRVVQLQTAPGKTLAGFVSDRLTTTTIEAPRGDMTDRRGRLLSASRFGQRVFVDPMAFPDPPAEAIAKLADALGVSTVEVAKRIIPAIERNQALESPPVVNEQSPLDPGSPVRFVAVSDVLDDTTVETIRGLRIDGKPIAGVHLETRSVREVPAGIASAALLGRVDVDHAGQVGAEKLLNKRLEPTAGTLRYVRDASGDPMWIFPGGYTPPQRGEDVRLSIDLEVQRIVLEELNRGVLEADAAGGRCIVLDPATGEILAMADVVRDVPGARDYDWNHIITKGGDGVRYRIIPRDPLSKIGPDLARNRCIEDIYEPGSTFKPFMWASALEAGVVRPEEMFETYNGHWHTPYGRYIEDVVPRGRQKWTEVLVNSSNIGMAQGVSRMSFEQTRQSIVEFGFGRRPGLGLPGESPGLVTSQKAWSKYTQTSVAFGYEVGVTPVQMALAFSAFCRTGQQAGTIPTLRLTAADYEQAATEPAKRVLPSSVAEFTRETMRGVTHNLDNRLANRSGDAKEVFRYEAFGKSGTARAPLGKAPLGKRKPKGSDGYYGAQYNVSFISGAPANEPRAVVLVVIDDPGPELVRKKQYYGAVVAGPINRRIMERTLSYLGVAPSQESGERVASTNAD